MPTVVTFTIGPSGKQYTSMTACRAANAKNLVTADEQHVYEFYTFAGGLNDNDAFVGYTDDATRNIILRAAPSDEWDGIDPKSGFYFRNTANNAELRPISGIQNMELDGICFDGSASAAGCFSVSNGGNFKSANNLGLIDVAGDNFPNGFSGTVDNVLIINPGDDGGIFTTAVNKLTVVNAGNRGILSASGSTITNSFSFGSTGDDFSNQGGTGHDYIATEDGTAPGANSLTGRTSADFANFAGADYRTASGSTLATAGSVDFIGYALEAAAGITVTENTNNTNYTSNDPVITLTGSISISETLVNSNYTSLNPSISLTGVVSITEATSKVNYTSLNPAIDLTGLVSIVESLENTNYSSLNPSITLTSATIKITEQVVGTQYQAKPPSILLTPPPLAIVSTVCFDGVIQDLSYDGSLQDLAYNGAINFVEFNGNMKELEFNGTIQTSCCDGSIKTDC